MKSGRDLYITGKIWGYYLKNCEENDGVIAIPHYIFDDVVNPRSAHRRLWLW